MNERQRLYLVQARSDWRVFQVLRTEPVCHRLHYLQMTMEKLGKAYFWRGKGAENIGHAVSVKFLRSISDRRSVAEALGFPDLTSFREWINDVSDLAYQLERLAPALAADGPNPEYPWPRGEPAVAPVEHEFAAWGRFTTISGNHLRRMIGLVLTHFPAWF